MRKGIELDGELCPLCGSEMVVKTGRYGYFWSCKSFPKCKGSINIKDLPNLKYSPVKYYNPDEFLQSEAYERIKDIIENDERLPSHIKPLLYYIDAGLYKGLVDDNLIKGKVSALLEFLMKHEMRFLLAQFSYFIYQIEGDLPDRFDFFLRNLYAPNTLEATVKHKQYQIQKAILNGWCETLIYKKYGLNLMGEEVSLWSLSGIESSCKVDLVGINDNKEIALIEIKRAAAGRSAWGQVHVYRKTIRKKHPAGVFTFVVTSGFPRGIVDDTIGLMGYTIQDNHITLIPWKEAQIVI